MKWYTGLLLCMAAMACNNSKQNSDVSIGIAIPSHVHAVAWLANDHGDFEKSGVKVRIDVMGGSAATARSLLADSTDVGLLGGDSVIKANAAGGDLVIVAGFVNRFYHRVVGRPELQGVGDLRGKKVGLPFLGGPQDMALRYALHQAGIDENEVEIMNLGRELNRIAALTRGSIDATLSQMPETRIVELGLVVLDDLPTRDVAFPYMMMTVRRSFLKAHPEQVRSALSGLCRATEFYRNQPKASRRLIDKHLHGSDTKRPHEHSDAELLSWPPIPREEGLHLVLGFLGPARTKGQQVQTLVDTTLLDELRARGECGGR